MEGSSSTAKELIPDEHGVQRTSTISDEASKQGHIEDSLIADDNGTLRNQEASEEDDWEAVADRPAEELLAIEILPSVSSLSLEDSEDTQLPKMRGRGTFYYRKEGLFSDDLVEEPVACATENTRASRNVDSDKGNHLVPPRQRPQTSVRTARRLIAQGMGIKLPSTGSYEEFRKEEEARRNRIVTRQRMRDEAWGGE